MRKIVKAYHRIFRTEVYKRAMRIRIIWAHRMIGQVMFECLKKIYPMDEPDLSHILDIDNTKDIGKGETLKE